MGATAGWWSHQDSSNLTFLYYKSPHIGNFCLHGTEIHPFFQFSSFSEESALKLPLFREIEVSLESARDGVSNC